MLIVNNISKKYHDKIIFDKFSLSFKKTGLYLLIGESGVGKSTLLNIIGLLENPDEGEIRYNNQNLTLLSQREKIMYISTYYGFVFQEYNLIEELTVYANIEIALGTGATKNRKEKIFKVLEQVNIGDLANKKVKYLSGGEKQRVAIARSLIKEAKIILIDEPTSNLDKENSRNLCKLLKDISQTKLVICASHDPILIDEFSENVISLTDNCIDVKLKEEKVNEEHDVESKLQFGKLRLKSMFMMILENIKKFISKTMSTISIFTILFIISLLFITIAFYNPLEAYKKELVRNNIRYSNLVDSHSDNIPANKKRDFSKILTNQLFPYYEVDIDIKDYSINKAFIINNHKLDDNEVLITDYIAEVLVKTSYFNDLDSKKGLINQVIDHQGILLTIKGIYDTDYENHENHINDINVNSFYSSIFLNKRTLNNLMKFDEQLEVRYYHEHSIDWNYLYLERYHDDLTIMIGNDNYTNKYDIIVSDTLLNDINKEIKVDKLKLSINKSEFNFNIIGIFHDEEPKVIVSEMDYISLKLVFSDNGIILSTNEELSELSCLQSRNIYLNSPFLSTYIYVEKGFSYIKNITAIILLIIIFAMFNTYKVFINQRVISRRREVGILLSMGISKIRINSIFILDSLFIIFASYIFSSAFSIWLINNFAELLKLFDIGFSFDLFNVNIYMVTFTAAIVVNIIYVWLLLRKIYKIKIIDLLRNE
jgi:ABC-type lipoprotein export system ATPase subunit/ABC-type antimicrobial peptide transport system permease subunit